MTPNAERLIEEIRGLPSDERDAVLAAFLEIPPAPAEPSPAPSEQSLLAGETDDIAYQRQLLAAGLIREIRPRRRDQEAFDRFTPVPITGEPLSETIIAERR